MQRRENGAGAKFLVGVFLTAIMIPVFNPGRSEADQPVVTAVPAQAAVAPDDKSGDESDANGDARLETSIVQSSASKPGNQGDGGMAADGEAQPEEKETGRIRMKFQGSYEISVDGVGVARGEGTTSVELSRAFIESLRRNFSESIGDSNLSGKRFLEGIMSLPSTVRSTNETLKMLSDPETQNALRQVEGLLRLLPRASAPPE